MEDDARVKAAWVLNKNVTPTASLPGALGDLAEENPEECVELHGNHLEGRYVNEQACWKRREVQGMIIGIIRNFHEFLDKHNINHWVDSGTLLGAVRDKGLIPYDVDADFGMDEPGYIFLRDNEVEVPEPYILNVWNSTMNDPGNRDEPLAVRFIHKKSGLYADMFVFKDDVDEEGKPVMGPPRSGCFGGCVRCPQDEDGGLFQVPDNWVFPVHMCKFEDFTVPCPHDSARYLDHLFGDDFMTHK